MNLQVINYAASGLNVLESFSASPVSALVLERDNFYPCPLRKLRERLDAWLPGLAEATTSVSALVTLLLLQESDGLAAQLRLSASFVLGSDRPDRHCTLAGTRWDRFHGYAGELGRMQV